MNATGKTLRAMLGVAVSLTLVQVIWAQGLAVETGLLPAAGAAGPVETRFFPLSEVKRGLRGVAYTVFEGVTPEAMEVEILGVLKDSLGPGQDMILARLHGTKPEYTGVVAGMSGSPVYIDGRLVGALSYRIGQFSKDPIAGITPIGLMLEVRDEGSSGATAKDRQASGQKPVVQLAKEGGWEGRVGVGGGSGMEMQAIETPLVFGGGFSQETVERFGERFRAMGMTPVAGLGGADAEAVQPEPLVAGSAVSAVLVRGDLSMAGTCTVTYVDPTRLLACGHPITQYGPVDMPMTKAEVVATLASPLNAFKIVNTTQTVGAFTEDRATAILGRFGVQARMIPVEVEVVPEGADGKQRGGKTKTLRFEVLDNRQLTPSTMLVSVYQSLQGTNVASAELSFRMRGEITVQGQEPVRIEGLMAQSEFNSGAINAALLVNDRFSRVYGNVVDQPVVTGMRLKVEAIAERRTAVLESARLSRTEVRAGETVDVEATVHPYQSAAKVVRVRFKVPERVAAGSVRVVVSDGATVDKLTSGTGAMAQHAVGLADTVAQINRLRDNEKVYVTLLEHSAQAVLESGTLEEVPASMANVLEPLKETQKIQLSGESAMEVGSVATEYGVSGSVVLSLQVR